MKNDCSCSSANYILIDLSSHMQSVYSRRLSQLAVSVKVNCSVRPYVCIHLVTGRPDLWLNFTWVIDSCIRPMMHYSKIRGLQLKLCECTKTDIWIHRHRMWTSSLMVLFNINSYMDTVHNFPKQKVAYCSFCPLNRCVHSAHVWQLIVQNSII